MKSNVDHSSARRESLNHVVGHVAWRVANCPATGVRCYHGRARNLQNVVERLVRHVGNVDQHPETVHFTDHFPAKFGEAVVTGRLVRGIGPVGCSIVCKCEVTHPAREKIAQDFEIVIDGVTALDAQQDGDFALRARGENLLRACGKRQIGLVLADLLDNRIQQIERATCGP